jgi:Ca2+-binding EF-hand superfamily protein
MRNLFLAGAAAVALTAGAAAGASADENQIILDPIIAACADGLAVADRNRDGWVTRAEAETAFPAQFELLDGDADGNVTVSEFMNCRAGTGMHSTNRRSATLLSNDPVYEADRDGNRMIDRAEWDAKAQELYAGMPTISGQARNASFDGAMSGFALLSEQADTNGDGLIGTIEAGYAITQGFILADADGDGVISFAEYATRDIPPDVTDNGPDQAALSARLADVWRTMDADGSGGVSYEEFHAAGISRFERTAAAAASDPDVAVPVSALDSLSGQ